MPRLSVIVPAYNVASYVGDAVGSVLAQTLRDIEVIVVDDGSTDGTADVVRRITDGRVRLLRKANGGLSSARNAGLRAARASFAGFLDGDDVWILEKAERQVARLESDPGVTMTYSHSAYLGEDGVPTGAVLRSSLASPTIAQMIRRNHVGNGSTPIGRTADFFAAGLFDERLRSAEDYEMWPRLMARTSRRLELVPEVLTGYRVRSASLSMRHDSFLTECERACAILREHLPEIPSAMFRQAMAEHCRIAARKAAAAGSRRMALSYLARSLGGGSMHLLADRRFWGTAIIALSGGRGELALHRMARTGRAA